MQVFESLTGKLHRPLIDFLETLARLLPDNQKLRLRRVIELVPVEQGTFQQILELLRSEWLPFLRSSPSQIVVVGPANTGKSSVVNALLGRPAASVSTQPRTTRSPGEYSGDVFSVLDTPGIEEFIGYGNEALWMKSVADASLILVVLDATLGLTAQTLRMVESVRQVGRPVLVVLNKMDAVADRAQTLAKARKVLGFDVVGISAQEPRSRRAILSAILDNNPETYQALAELFPQHRRTIASSIVSRTAMVAGTLGALPSQKLKSWSVAAAQGSMILKIARVFGYPLTLERLRELAPALGGVLLLQNLSRRLSDSLERRVVVDVAMAGALTYGLGQGAISYFERGARDMAAAREAVVVAYHSWLQPSD